MKHRRGRNMPRIPRPKRIPRHAGSVTGIVSVSAQGYGFVTPEGVRGADIFIPARDMSNAFDGDLVEVALISDRDLPAQYAGKGATGRIVKILKRRLKGFVGELLPGNMVMPLSKKLSRAVPIAGGVKGAHPGDWIDVSLHPADSDHGPRCAVERIVGVAGTIQGDLDAVVANYDLPEPYSEEDEAEALRIEPLMPNREKVNGIFCATIDPTDAKDHDDALSLERSADGKYWLLGVHIADVSAYIRAGTKWDREARRRCFTAYLPGRTLPMLPRGLTATISLAPGRISHAMSVFFTIERKSGVIVESRMACTEVTLTHDFNYDEVQLFIDTNKAPKWEKSAKDHLRDLVDLTRKLRANRLRDEKFLELAVPEIRPIIGEGGNHIDRIERRVQRESEMLVEECMLAANTAVAQRLHRDHIPAIYRVHDEPGEEAFVTFAEQMEVFGLRPGMMLDRDECNAFFESVKGEEYQAAVMSAFVRLMPRAIYDAECRAHYGLGKLEYLHFTSPIRRYTDLLVHRQLHALLENGHLLSGSFMLNAAVECSEKEALVDEASFSASDRMKLHYLKQIAETDPGHVWAASVNRMISGGMSVEILELGLYGIVETALLEPPPAMGKRGRKAAPSTPRFTIRPGTHVDLILARIDFTKGVVFFAPADRAEPLKAKEGKRRARR